MKRLFLIVMLCLTIPSYSFANTNSLYSEETSIDINNLSKINSKDKNETLKYINHYIQEKHNGYMHNISFNNLDTSSKEIIIDINTLGNINEISSSNSVSLKDNQIIVKKKNKDSVKETIKLIFMEEKEKGYFIKNPANIEYSEIPNYHIKIRRDYDNNLILWKIGESNLSHQSPLIIIFAISTIISLILFKATNTKASIEKKLIISSTPIMISLSIINSSFLFSYIAFFIIILLNKKLNIVENKNNKLNTLKVLSIIIFIFNICIINIFNFNTSFMFDLLSGVSSTLDISYGKVSINSIHSYLFHSLSLISERTINLEPLISNDIKIVEIPLTFSLFIINIPSFILILLNIKKKRLK